MKFCRTAALLTRTGAFLCTALFMVSAAGAQTPADPGGRDQPWFSYPASSAQPVVEYTLVHHILADPAPEPLLRVYADGRVHAHFPGYMKKAGEYEYRLSQRELNSLLTSLAQDGVIDFDPVAARQEKQQLIAQRRAGGKSLIYISDSTDTVIRIRLAAYQRNAQSPRIENLDKRLVWTDLEHDARQFPQANAIQGAAAGARKLHELLEHPGLRRIE